MVGGVFLEYFVYIHLSPFAGLLQASTVSLQLAEGFPYHRVQQEAQLSSAYMKTQPWFCGAQSTPHIALSFQQAQLPGKAGVDMEGGSTFASLSVGLVYLRSMLSSHPPGACQKGEKIS